jgi:hypothetical protein
MNRLQTLLSNSARAATQSSRRQCWTWKGGILITTRALALEARPRCGEGGHSQPRVVLVVAVAGVVLVVVIGMKWSVVSQVE